MRKLIIAALLLCASLIADAAPQTIQVTIGASTTQVSATNLYCSWIVFQNNAGHNIRIGDVNTTSSRGIALASGTPGGSWQTPVPQPNKTFNLAQWYIAGTQNDVIDVVCDTVTF